MKRIVSAKKILPAVISNLRGSTVAAQNAVTTLLEAKGILKKYYDIEQEDLDVLDSAASILETIQASLEVKSVNGD